MNEKITGEQHEKKGPDDLSLALSEEKIGCLWCIIAVLSYMSGIEWLMFVSGLKASMSLVLSMYFLIKNIKPVK